MTNKYITNVTVLTLFRAYKSIYKKEFLNVTESYVQQY